ncbi:MAG: hypothetical protein WCX82_04405 [archaeon]|jgi:hypothetical protein
MAKPIRATPTLRGEDAKRFVREWIEECKHPSPARVKFIREAEAEEEFYLNLLKKAKE